MAQSATDAFVLAPGGITADSQPAENFAVSVAHRVDEVEADWLQLIAGGVESPGQHPAFIRLWIEALGIREEDCLFVVARDGGVPVALLPLQRRWDKGVRVLSWFPGRHVGCGAPAIDAPRLTAMGPERRRRLWLDMLRGIPGADVVHLRSVPRRLVDGVDLFAELGQSIAGDTLYRAAFDSFESADRTQRNKSRRKHDRQQGEKLEAMGAIGFETLANGPEAEAVLDTMFRQRAARFVEMGVADPFAVPAIRAFYDSTVRAGSGLPVCLHLLRLDGRIVAMRYNVVAGDRLFCLISSMSEDAALRPGSPGKQCLLRVMQAIFADGYRLFDMGEGLTDEKRHWCNEQIALRHHYVPITRRGAIAAALHRGWQLARHRIKSDERLLGIARALRGRLLRGTRRSPAGDVAES